MDLNKSLFTEHLIRLNALRFGKWIFEPGMLFGAEMKWWGDKGMRKSPHNGLDLRLYEDNVGALKTIGEGTKIPIIYGGRIVRVIRDFLGHSMFVAHEIYREETQLFTIYGHVLQSPDAAVGETLKEGTEIATLAKPSNRNVPGHLHISLAFIPKSVPVNTLTWEFLDNSKTVRFINPQRVI